MKETQADLPGSGTENSDLVRMLRATKDLADYAQWQYLSGAAELLSAITAALLATRTELSHDELPDPEDLSTHPRQLSRKTVEPE